MLSKIQDFLIPNFLKRLDFWLMTHKPHVWRTRGHFVVFYGIIVALLFFLFGLMYPQTLYELSNAGRGNTDITFLFTLLSFLLALGGVFSWWYAIQKFPYKRTSVVHYLIEISIYTLSLFALWSVVWAFYFGFFYKRCYMLEKNKAEDKTWFYEHDFSSFGYMPHVKATKLEDLNAYFSDGEKLIDLQKTRDDKASASRQYNDNNRFVFGDMDFESSLGVLDWEFKTNYFKPQLPPQYLTYSDYFNNVISNDSIRIVERKRCKIKDTDYFFDNFFPALDNAKIVEATTNTYARYFHHINFGYHADKILEKQVIDWLTYERFLESLNDGEMMVYKVLLQDLNLYYQDYDTSMVSIKQPLIVAYNSYKIRERQYPRQRDEDEDEDESELYIMKSDYYSGNHDINFGNQDKNIIASEKLEKALSKFDKNTIEKLENYISRCDVSFADRNVRDKNIDKILDITYSVLKPNTLDSLFLYDYYTLKHKNHDAFRAFYTHAYIDYVANKKYSANDLDRLYNLLKINGFKDKTPKYRSSKLQKIELLEYSKEYESAMRALINQRTDLKEKQIGLWSPVSLLYCLLGAFVFYALTLSTGLQFWIAAFISGVYWSVMMFLSEIFRWGRNGTYSRSANLTFIFMVIYCFVFTIIILQLSFNKKQWNKAHILVNTVLISGLGAVLASLIYWHERVSHEYNLAHKGQNVFPLENSLMVISNVLIVSILIYAIIAWLFKRHLTYPKKK
jgi:hypothetical protein